MPWTKPESLWLPNFDLSEKIEKVVVKFQKETVWNALGLLKLWTKSRLKESGAS